MLKYGKRQTLCILSTGKWVSLHQRRTQESLRGNVETETHAGVTPTRKTQDPESVPSKTQHQNTMRTQQDKRKSMSVPISSRSFKLFL